MAARIKKLLHDDETRARIQAAAIINRFQDCLDGKVVLDAQQVSVGKSLLNKVLPDLSSTTLKGDTEAPIVHEIRRTIVDPRNSDSKSI